MISNRFSILNRLHTFVQSKESLCVKSIQLLEYGNPSKVLKIGEEKLIASHDDQVLLKILAAPIHPTHIELIRGDRPEQVTKFPFVPGSECVAEIVSTGEDVSELSVGQRVIVPYAETISERGTWTTYALYNSEDVLPIPDDMGIAEAATLAFYPCAAYRILKDFITLKAGDCVLFNGGYTSIGQAVHQLCKVWNVHSVSVVRPEADETIKNYLRERGATEVFSPKELLESKIFENGTLPKPLLALSCVARSSSRLLGQFLSPNGIMVAFGSMAGYPAAAATTAFAYKDFVLRPFWIEHWNKNNPKKEARDCMLDELFNLIKIQKFRAPEMECVPFAQFKDAFLELENLKMKGAILKKFILDMSSEN